MKLNTPQLPLSPASVSPRFFHSPGANVCSTVCAADDDVSHCASSAVNGYKAWSSLTCHQRAKVLLGCDTLTFTHQTQRQLFEPLS